MSAVCGCTDLELLEQARARHGAKVVYLLREDFAAVALSLEHARRSKVFVARRTGEPLDDSRLVVQVPAFLQRVRWHAAHAARYSRLMRARLPGGYLRVTYEELQRSPEPTLNAIFEYRVLHSNLVAAPHEEPAQCQAQDTWSRWGHSAHANSHSLHLCAHPTHVAATWASRAARSTRATRRARSWAARLSATFRTGRNSASPSGRPGCGRSCGRRRVRSGFGRSR